MELTKWQIEGFAKKLFDDSFPNHEHGSFEDQDSFVQRDWINAAHAAVDGYNDVAKHIEFPGISIVKNCCLICKFVDLHRPACNMNGDDITLEYICDKFQLAELYRYKKGDKKTANEEFWKRIMNNSSLNSYDPYHY